MDNESSVSFSRICKAAMISRDNAEDLLSDLISIGIVNIHYTDKGFRFSKV